MPESNLIDFQSPELVNGGLVPTFDTQQFFVGTPRVAGYFPWISAKPIRPAFIAPLVIEKNRTGKSVIVFNSPHGLEPGDRIYVNGAGVGVDRWYEVELHPDPKVDTSKAIVIANDQVASRIPSLTVHLPEIFSLVPPKYLPQERALELESLDFLRLQGMQILDPQRMLATLAKLRQDTLGYSSTTVEDQTDGDATLDGGVVASDEDAASSDNVERAKNFFEGRELEFEADIQGLLDKYAQEMSSAQELTHEEFAALRKIQFKVRVRECEILLGMPTGHIGGMVGFEEMGHAIENLYQWIINTLAQLEHQETYTEAAPEGNEKPAPSSVEPRNKRKPKQRSRT
jgi:hypothetical protein